MDGKSTEVSVGAHRISVTVFGSGEPAVVIEPAFGGSAQSWHAIAGTLGEQTTVVTYDRAPYGASSRALDRRTPGDIAGDLARRQQLGRVALPATFARCCMRRVAAFCFR